MILFLALSSLSIAHAAVLTTWGTSDFLNPTTSFSNTTYTANSTSIIGSDFGSSLFGELNSSVNILTTDVISLTGVYSGTATSIFQIEFFDEDGDSRIYQSSWADFTIGIPSTVQLSFVGATGGAFGLAASLDLLTAGSGNQVNMLLTELTAIPEPNTAILVIISGILALGRQVRACKQQRRV